MYAEHGIFRRLRRAVVGIPVLKGHGDLNDIDPAAVANETRKIKLGVVDQIRKGAKGIEAHFALDNDGAEAVQAGWKLPSAFWLVKPLGNDADGTIRCRPCKLISVALTQWPNIRTVEALDNEIGLANFDPSQPRDERGQWSGDGGSAGDDVPSIETVRNPAGKASTVKVHKSEGGWAVSNLEGQTLKARFASREEAKAFVHDKITKELARRYHAEVAAGTYQAATGSHKLDEEKRQRERHGAQEPRTDDLATLHNTQEKAKNIMLRDQIIGALIAKGVALPNEVTDAQLLEAVANGDYPGHPFHGNQYVGGEEGGAHNEASHKAHESSKGAKGREGHTHAAKMHERAARAHDKAAKARGDDSSDTADMHRAMAKYHAGRAARFKDKAAPPKVFFGGKK